MSATIEDQTIRRRLLGHDTPAISDALDAVGFEGQAVGLLPMAQSAPMAGRAFTVRMLPVGRSGRSVGDYIDDVPAGSVVVIDNGGRTDTTVWGDLLTVTAARNGVQGVVIDGVCRDTPVIAETGFAAYSRSHTMRTGKDRVAAEEYGAAVQLAGVRVEPGDWVLGDRDGVVVIPEAIVAEVLDRADRISAAEERIRAGLAAGERLDVTRRALGYHALQSRSS